LIQSKKKKKVLISDTSHVSHCGCHHHHGLGHAAACSSSKCTIF